MTQKPDSCKGCVLYETGKGFVPDEVVPNPEVVIIGDSPSNTEAQTGKAFTGTGGFVLKSWILKAVPTLQIAYERKKMSLCHLLKCVPPITHGRSYPTGETRELAESHCKQYLQIGNPKLVILCGEPAQRHFFGKELAEEDATDRSTGRDAKGVMGRAGRVYERDGIRWVLSPHPSAVLAQPAMVGHMQESFKIAAGVEKVLEPTVLHWREAMSQL